MSLHARTWDWDGDSWQCADIGAAITPEPDGFVWSVVEATFVIVGVYPGSPDWVERDIASGTAPSLNEAKWACERAWARDQVRADVEAEEEAEAERAMEAADAYVDQAPWRDG